MPFLLFPCPEHHGMAAVAACLRNLSNPYICSLSSYKPAFGSQAGGCLEDDIRSRGTCWQGHFLLPQGKKVSGDDSESDSYYLILLFDLPHPSSLYKLRSLNLSPSFPTCYLQHLCLFFPFQSESGRIFMFLMPEEALENDFIVVLWRTLQETLS